VLSTLSRNVAIVLCPPCSLSALICVTPSLTAPLCPTLLSAPHRRRHEQHHKHDRDRDRDHDDAAANREHDKAGVGHATPFRTHREHTQHASLTRRGGFNGRNPSGRAADCRR
jgi:hypothetical protein